MEKINYNVTSLNTLIASLESQVDKNSEEYSIFHSYMELQRKLFEEENANADMPFISVITRTQGRRPDMLTEMLLCLCGQSDTDFEVIIAGHNLSDEQTKTVSDIINDLPEWMRNKTRLLPVSGGSRATPLNKGFEAAKGRYCVILDDDDIVFDNWIETFKKYDKIAPGKIIHSYVFQQDWETVNKEYYNTPIAVNKPSEFFCRDYIFERQLVYNCCPTLGLAYPSYAFKKLNIHFDEGFNTTEDWDFLVRTAVITGVINAPVATSIYRNWLNTENSQTIHNKKEWEANYNKIVGKFMSLPTVLDKYSMKTIISPYFNKGGGAEKTSLELYYDDGQGFSAAKMLLSLKEDFADWLCAFDLSKLGSLYAIRIDPCQNGCITVKTVEIKLVYADGTEQTFGRNQVITNGYKVGDSTVFLKDDPQIILPLKLPKKINKVFFNIDLEHSVSDAAFDKILGKRSIFYRLAKKGYSLLRKIGRLLKR